MRKPVITRTIKTANVSVLGVDLTITEVVNRTFPVYASELPKDNTKRFEYVRKMYETDTFKVSQIVDIKEEDKTFSMPLEDFLRLADVVNPKQNAETQTESEN